jgi:hypothetical protein
MMGKIWESAMREAERSLYFSDLPVKSALLAGERLRPLGHVYVDPRNDKNPYAQGRFSQNRQDTKCGPTFLKVQADAGTCTQIHTKFAQFVHPSFFLQSASGPIWC